MIRFEPATIDGDDRLVHARESLAAQGRGQVPRRQVLLRQACLLRSPPLKNLFIRQAAGLTGEVPRLLKGEAL